MEVLLVGTIHLGYTPDIHTLSKDDTDKYSDVTWHNITSKNPYLFSNSNRLIIERSWKNVLKFGHIVKGAFFYDDFS